jgi:putative hydrolase of HD superfamily
VNNIDGIEMNETEKLLKFLDYSEGLKNDLRHTWLSNGRQESAADHSWRMALIAMIIAPNTKLKLNMEKVFKLITIHDLVEIDAKDIPSFIHMNNKEIAAQKDVAEQKAAEKIIGMLDRKSGKNIGDLWKEFSENQTAEAKFVHYLDKIEARTQKYLQNPDTLVEGEKDLKQSEKYSRLIETLANNDEYLLELAKTVKSEKKKRLGF